MSMVFRKIAKQSLLALSKLYLKHDFFSVEGQYELEEKLRQHTWLRRSVLQLSRIVGKPQTYYHILKIDREQILLEQLADNRSVRRGPFVGMKYPSLASYGSVLAAKIIGSYELELVSAIEETLRKPYRQVLDIGCAEGYYAVGYALKLPKTQIHAFDINKDTLARCKKMAVLNQVDHKMTYYSRCSPEFLKEFDFSRSSLIISDCEGYEVELFTEKVISHLGYCDLLIEVHEKVHPGITQVLTKRFASTHRVQSLTGQVRDINHYPELADFSDQDKHLILYELRNQFEDYLRGQNPGRWLYVTALDPT